MTELNQIFIMEYLSQSPCTIEPFCYCILLLLNEFAIRIKINTPTLYHKMKFFMKFHNEKNETSLVWSLIIWYAFDWSQPIVLFSKIWELALCISKLLISNCRNSTMPKPLSSESLWLIMNNMNFRRNLLTKSKQNLAQFIYTAFLCWNFFNIIL